MTVATAIPKRQHSKADRRDRDAGGSQFVSKTGNGSPALETESSEFEQSGRLITAPVDEFQSLKEYDLETDYHPFAVQMEGNCFLHLLEPLRLGFLDEPGTIEVIGWNLSVPAGEFAKLPRHIARKFFHLYSGALGGTLSEQDESALGTVSKQADYRRYSASRSLPKYREATLIRKEPLLLQFYDTSNVKLDPSLAPALRLLEPNDRFGAWFSSTEDGKITDVVHVTLLPAVDSMFEAADSYKRSENVAFDPSLLDLLPKRDSNEA